MKWQRLRSMACWALLTLVAGCSTTPEKPPAAKPGQNELNELGRLKAEANKPRPGEATLIHLNRFISSHPPSDATDQAAILAGNLYYQRQDYKNALTSYMRVINSPVASAHEDEALILAARCQFHLGRGNETLNLLNTALNKNSLSRVNRSEATELRFLLNSQMGRKLDSLHDIVALVGLLPDGEKKQRYRAKGSDLVESKLAENELAQVAQDSSFEFLQIDALFRMGQIHLERGEADRARDNLVDVRNKSTVPDQVTRAKQIIDQIDARRRVSSNTIGVVLPLSGKYQAMGYRSLHGIQLALGIFSNRPSGFRLAVVDSEGNPDIARRVVEKLVTEDSVVAIIGALLSKTAVAEASKSHELGVPFMALSQGSGVTEIGAGIFRNALTSQMQVQNLVAVAMDKMGYKRFAVLFPNDSYGNEFANQFWDAVVARGGQINGAQTYDSKETDFRVPVQKLVGTYYQEERADELRLRLKEWQDKQVRKTNKPPPENLLPPVVDFDALFIPDSAKAIGQIAPMLAYNDVDHIKLIGTNLWNTPELVKRGQKFVEDALFVDSLMDNDPGLKSSKFFNDFKAQFQDEPGLFELQAYDSAAILRQVISDGNNSRSSVIQALTKLRNFQGALGPLSMNERREVIRPMINLTVEKGEIVRAKF